MHATTHISISIETIRPHSTASLTVPIITPRQPTALLIVTYLPTNPRNPVPPIRPAPMTSLQHLRQWPTYCISINNLLSNHSRQGAEVWSMVAVGAVRVKNLKAFMMVLI